MKYLTSLIVLAILFPSLASAATIDKSEEIALLWQEVYQLETEIQQILSQQQSTTTTVIIPASVKTTPKITPEQQIHQNCIKSQVSQYESQGFPYELAYKKADINCPDF